MTRLGKQEERRHKYPHKRKNPSVKTGSLKDKLPIGFKQLDNSLEGDVAKQVFIAKTR